MRGPERGRASSEMRSRSSPSADSSTIGPGQSSLQSRRERRNRSKLSREAVRGLHLGQLDAAAAGRVEIEERRASEEPAHRLLRDRKRVDVGDDPRHRRDSHRSANLVARSDHASGDGNGDADAQCLVNRPELTLLSALTAQMSVWFRAVRAITRGRLQARSALMRPITRRQLRRSCGVSHRLPHERVERRSVPSGRHHLCRAHGRER